MRVPPSTGDSSTFAEPLAKPAAPPCPSNFSVYERGAAISASVSRPLNFALTGPTRAVISTRYSVSDTRSIDSQPGIHLRSTSGSFSARHVVATSAGTTRLPFISMIGSGSRSRRAQVLGAPAASGGPAGECLRQLLQALQVVHRQKIVDKRQHRADARRPRFETLVAQQRIEPDQPPARLGQPFHFLRQTVPDVAVQAVTDKQNDGALSEEPARPAPIEFAEARPDARAAGPVGDRAADARNRDIDVALLQMARNVGQARSEQKRVHAIPVIGDRVQEE